MSTVTLSQVLSLHTTVRLYGHRISDLAPRGDLGLGLDPAGPLGFASIRSVVHDQQTIRLPKPLILSVFGEGEPMLAGDAAGQPGERTWTLAMGDRALQLDFHQGTLSSLLAEFCNAELALPVAGFGQHG